MRKTLIASTAVLAILGASFAGATASESDDAKLANAELGAVLGTTEAEVRSVLEGKGFTVAKVEVEDDEIEAEVEHDGKTYEIEVDARTGKITGTELEEDDD